MNREGIDRNFSFRRLGLLMRNKAYEDAPGLGIGLATLAGINLLTILFGKMAMMNDGEGTSYYVVIILSGLLLASVAFKSMHGRSSADWILLPATPLEKYSAALASHVIIYPVLASVVLAGFSVLLSLAERVAGGVGGRIWHPFTLEALRVYGEYAVVAVAFLAGSAAFRKKAFLKTVGVSTAFVLVCSLLVLLGLRIIYGAYSSDSLAVSFDTGVLSVAGMEIVNHEGFLRIFEYLVNGVRFILVPLFSIVFAYLRVYEKEARDEVQ
ncbi:MAG: hypothetical protein RBT62_11085 [Spirochaetia bacterium]|jgi:hypothetical protein|nr:hypothetical protein [Spirochaetia bacterium]